MKTNLNLRKDYTNVTEGMSDKWIERFEKAKNEKVVEKLFDFLEEKITEESKKLNSLTEDLTINVAVISRSYKNFLQVNLEKMVHNTELDAWEEIEEYPIAIEVQIADYYKNWEEPVMQEMVEDFLNRLPDPIDLALI